ncbi:hypothetical protein C922_05753 [Plasmodium inui San Antonio 1]|uniref:Uncharacterized protein n=1 Tax=Plasmodium inui San Antonio 1 TaxID=1237626 RepID=W6ZSI3_9APIC|nr:hypothetical protein C922_05753 [Plasmodium inui San Antonio 1]EUD63867.1 hypothetical protein C922_05753 [Plasmodium inui San Antonio 1]
MEKKSLEIITVEHNHMDKYRRRIIDRNLNLEAIDIGHAIYEQPPPITLSRPSYKRTKQEGNHESLVSTQKINREHLAHKSKVRAGCMIECGTYNSKYEPKQLKIKRRYKTKNQAT